MNSVAMKDARMGEKPGAISTVSKTLGSANGTLTNVRDRLEKLIASLEERLLSQGQKAEESNGKPEALRGLVSEAEYTDRIANTLSESTTWLESLLA